MTARVVSSRSWLLPSISMQWACVSACLVVGVDAAAQAASQAAPVLPPVTVSAMAYRDPVEKSYRKMLRGMDLFEKQRATLAPNASLRFKLLPRRRDTDMRNIVIDVIGSRTDFPVPLAPDQTFTLDRNPQALAEDAQVVPNRKAQSLTWRSEIRTPGLPPGTRRLGDLRLECQVGMEAGLISGNGGLLGRMASAVLDSPAYCDKMDPRYLFFADQPVFSVTLVAGTRRFVLPVAKLYAAASDGRESRDVSDCDCELLLDRTYFLPLGDRSWPDDTLVEFETMDGE